jgi:hypothetical protein
MCYRKMSNSLIDVFSIIMAVFIGIIVAVLVFMANFINTHGIPWLMLVSVILVSVGKILQMVFKAPGEDNSWICYWNIGYMALLLVGGLLTYYSRVFWSKIGVWILAVSSFVDLGITGYVEFSSRKKVAPATGTSEPAESKAMVKSGETYSFVPSFMTGAGDLALFIGSVYTIVKFN